MPLARNVKKCLGVLAAMAGCYGVLVFSYSAFLKINYPYMVNLGEPPLSQAVRFVYEGKIPYRDLSNPPYSLVPYGPVYLYLCAFFRRWVTAPFVVGRIWTLFSTCLTAGFIYLTLKKDTGRLKYALLPVLLFLSHPIVARWGVQVNVDMMAVSFALASFYCLWSYVQADLKPTLFLVAGAFLSLVAFFTKSSMMACPAAFFCFLLLQKKIRTAFIFLLGMGLAAGSVYYLLNWWTHGAYFFHTTYEISKRHFFPVFIGRFWILAVRQSPLFVAANLFALWQIRQRDKRSFFYLYLFFVLLLTVSLGKQGSDTNYFLEWLSLSSVALGGMLHRLFSVTGGRGESGRRLWAEAGFYALMLCQLAPWIAPSWNLVRVKQGYEASRVFFDRISALIKKTPGKIISADMSLLTANDREIFYEPFPMGQMSYSGVWDERLILKELDERTLSLVILFFYAKPLKADRNYTPEFMETFKRNYDYIGRAIPPPDMDSDLGGHPLYFYLPKKN